MRIKWKKEVEKVLEREGMKEIVWKLTGSNHLKATGICPCPKQRRVSVITSLTPSDGQRTLLNVRGDLRRQLRTICEDGTVQGAEETFN